MSRDILSFKENGMLKIVLNRPEKKNAITIPMYKTLLNILYDSIPDKNIHVVVLTGSGNFFSSGHDFSGSLSNDNSDVTDPCDVFKRVIDTLITYPKLLVAVVNGPAIGVAVTILPLFDMIYASDRAYFQTPFTSLGISAEGCSTYTFPKIFGPSKAGDMLYMGYKMNAIEAKQRGLVSEIYEHGCLDDVWTYLNKLSKLSSESILAIKRLVKKWEQKKLMDVNAEEIIELRNRLESPEFMERFLNLRLQKNKI